MSSEDMEDLARGATFLGSGGGGDPTADALFTESLLDGEKFSATPLFDCPDDALVILVASIGAPLVSAEKLLSGNEWSHAFELIEDSLQRQIHYVASAEIGGSNAFAGIMAARTTGKRLLDADTLGRAFPTLNISSCALASLPLSISSIVDSMGNGVVIHTSSPETLERYARALVTQMGSTASCALYPMTGKMAKKALIPDSLSRALAIGRLLRGAHSLQHFLEAFSLFSYRFLGDGVVSDIRQEIEEGFLRGSITIEGKNSLRVEFQNEYLAVFQNERPISTTPDIIVLLETETLEPLGSDQVRHGIDVSILAVACPSLWTTPKGLLMTSPQAFGYPFSPVLLGDVP